MINNFFISQKIKAAAIDRFVRQHFPAGDYSDIEVQNTPLGVKIVIYTNKPGKIIGKGGLNINNITESLRVKFSLENPQIDVKEIKNPDMDAKIVATQIRSALEKGYNFKKIGNLTLKRIIDAGAMGAEIVIAGKLGGSKSATGKFIEGNILHSGDLVNTLVDEGFEVAHNRPGAIGIHVRIMQATKSITGEVMTKAQQREKEAKVKEAADLMEKELKAKDIIESLVEEAVDTEEGKKKAKPKRPAKKAKKKAEKAG